MREGGLEEGGRIIGGEAKGLEEGGGFGRRHYIHTTGGTPNDGRQLSYQSRSPPGRTHNVTAIQEIVARKRTYKNGYPFSLQVQTGATALLQRLWPTARS